MIYKLYLSNKSEFDLDEEDYQVVSNAMGTGGFAQLKQAIINPSFIVAIIPQRESKEKKIEGYFDEEKRKFIVTSEEMVEKSVEDKFIKQDDTKQLPRPV